VARRPGGVLLRRIRLRMASPRQAAACNIMIWDEGIGVLLNQIRVHCLYEPFNGKGKGSTATSKAGGSCTIGGLVGDVL